MKRCPQCSRRFEDKYVICKVDGFPLETVPDDGALEEVGDEEQYVDDDLPTVDDDTIPTLVNEDGPTNVAGLASLKPDALPDTFAKPDAFEMPGIEAGEELPDLSDPDEELPTTPRSPTAEQWKDDDTTTVSDPMAVLKPEEALLATGEDPGADEGPTDMVDHDAPTRTGYDPEEALLELAVPVEKLPPVFTRAELAIATVKSREREKIPPSVNTELEEIGPDEKPTFPDPKKLKAEQERVTGKLSAVQLDQLREATVPKSGQSGEQPALKKLEIGAQGDKLVLKAPVPEKTEGEGPEAKTGSVKPEVKKESWLEKLQSPKREPEGEKAEARPEEEKGSAEPEGKPAPKKLDLSKLRADVKKLKTRPEDKKTEARADGTKRPELKKPEVPRLKAAEEKKPELAKPGLPKVKAEEKKPELAKPGLPKLKAVKEEKKPEPAKPGLPKLKAAEEKKPEPAKPGLPKLGAEKEKAKPEAKKPEAEKGKEAELPPLPPPPGLLLAKKEARLPSPATSPDKAAAEPADADRPEPEVDEEVEQVIEQDTEPPPLPAIPSKSLRVGDDLEVWEEERPFAAFDPVSDTGDLIEPKPRWYLWAAGGAVAALLAVIVLVWAVGGKTEGERTKPKVVKPAPPTPTAPPAPPEPTTTVAQPSADAAVPDASKAAAATSPDTGPASIDHPEPEPVAAAPLVIPKPKPKPKPKPRLKKKAAPSAALKRRLARLRAKRRKARYRRRSKRRKPRKRKLFEKTIDPFTE